MKPFKIWENVYQVGGPELSDPYDCCVYLIDFGDLVLIDSGAGRSSARLVENIVSLGFEPEKLKIVLATHAHIDHVGSLRFFRRTYGAQVMAHVLDAKALERGTGIGAEAYGVPYERCVVEARIDCEQETVKVGRGQFKVVHVPGHTRGSVAAYIESGGKRVLFGQDIHGPYRAEWGADPVQARASLKKLIDLKADILCEGHFGVFQPADAVEKYIRRYLESLG